MEENLDSLVARIGELEKRMEQGIPVAPGGVPYGAAGTDGMNYGAGVAGGGQMPYGADGAGAGNRPVLPKAIPEDVQQVVKNWRSIIQDMPGGTRTYLKKAHLSLGSDNALLIVLDDEVAEGFINSEIHRQELKDAISARVGKEVELQIRQNDSGFPAEQVYPDIEKLINIDITIEEDE